MKSFKKVLSVVLALSMVLGMMTTINVSAADADIIYETFDADFVIDNANKTITTGTEGLTATAHDKIFAKGTMAVTDNGLFVPAPAGDGDKKGVDFKFAPITEGVTEISFDLNVTAVGYSYSSTLGQLVGTQADGETVKEAHRAFGSPAQTQGTTGKGKNIFFNTTLVAAQGEKFRATYVIDYNTGKIETLVNGISLSTENIRNSVTSIDTLKFFDDYNPDAYYIDNLTIVRNADANQKTITFEGIDGVEPITATYGRGVTLPISEVDGQVFGGWLDADGNAVDTSILLTEDMTLTANVRPIQSYRETFDNFSINYDEKTITTDSGFKVSAHDGAFGNAEKLKVENGALKVIGMDYNSKAYDTDVYFDFEPIIAGTAKISMDINPISWGSSAGHSGTIFAIGDENMTYSTNTAANPVGKNSISYMMNSTSDFGKGLVLNGETGLKTKWTGEWVKVEYIITMPDSANGTAGSYDVYLDGALAAEDVAFKNPLTSISRIVISQNPGANEGTLRNSNNYWDNITLVENADDSMKTITFMDGETVYDEKSVALFGDTVFPAAPAKAGKTFLGWFTAEEDGEAVTAEMLENITANATYYARFRDAAMYRETFESFTIDNTNKTMTTSSGLAVSATDALYAFKPAVTEGMLEIKGFNNYVASETETNGKMTFKFPEIKGGKVAISVDIAMQQSGFSNWMAVWGTPHLTIGNGEGDAAKLYFRGTVTGYQNPEAENFLATTNASSGATNNVIGVIEKGADAKKIEYIIDMDAKTYSVTWNGQTTKNIAFAGDITTLDTITLQFAATQTKNKNGNFKFDNLTIVENPDTNKKKVTFMDGEKVLETFDVVVYGDVNYAAPAKGDMIFLGWTDADGEFVDEDSFKGITADVTYYATYRDRVKLKETFGDGFAIDNDAKTVSTNSGFGLEIGADAPDASYFKKTDDGAIYLSGNEPHTNPHRTDLYLDFPDVTAAGGKTYISFELKPGSFWNASTAQAHAQAVFAIGNKNITDSYLANNVNAIAAYKARYKNADNTVNGKYLEDKKTGTHYELVSGQFNKFEFIIDMENKTYDMAINGAWVNGNEFLAGLDTINRIAFPQTNDWYSNNGLSVDNVVVIENFTDADIEPEPEPTKYTVNFYNEDGVTLLYTTEVEEGATAVYAGATPAKTATAEYSYVFAGWDKALTGITANTDVKATFTATKNQYTVTFVDHDGSTLGTSTVDYGTAATAPADPTRDGYKFTGWDKTFTAITENMTVTAQYEVIAVEPEVTTDGYFESTIEPMSLAEAAAIFGATEADLEGLYAWKVKHSISGIELYKSGSAFAGYTGRLFESIQVSLRFGDDVGAYVNAMAIQDESAIKLLDYGMDKVNGANSYNTFIISTVGEPKNCYPYTNTTETITRIDDAIVTLLITNTDTFDLEIYGECEMNEYWIEDGATKWPTDPYVLRTDKDYVAEQQKDQYGDYHYAERTPINLTVENGTVTSGAVVAPENPGVEVLWGDVNGDKQVDSTDGTFIINSTIGSGKTNENNDYVIGQPFAYDSTGKELIWGDVNGDGQVDSTDGTFIINSTIGSGKTNENNDYVIGETYIIK